MHVCVGVVYICMCAVYTRTYVYVQACSTCRQAHLHVRTCTTKFGVVADCNFRSSSWIRHTTQAHKTGVKHLVVANDNWLFYVFSNKSSRRQIHGKSSCVPYPLPCCLSAASGSVNVNQEIVAFNAAVHTCHAHTCHKRSIYTCVYLCVYASLSAKSTSTKAHAGIYMYTYMHTCVLM
jgi:hypothetical protein